VEWLQNRRRDLRDLSCLQFFKFFRAVTAAENQNRGVIFVSSASGGRQLASLGRP
jgi:hypothetical protein